MSCFETPMRKESSKKQTEFVDSPDPYSNHYQAQPVADTRISQKARRFGEVIAFNNAVSTPIGKIHKDIGINQPTMTRMPLISDVNIFIESPDPFSKHYRGLQAKTHVRKFEFLDTPAKLKEEFTPLSCLIEDDHENEDDAYESLISSITLRNDDNCQHEEGPPEMNETQINIEKARLRLRERIKTAIAIDQSLPDEIRQHKPKKSQQNQQKLEINNENFNPNIQIQNEIQIQTAKVEHHEQIIINDFPDEKINYVSPEPPKQPPTERFSRKSRNFR